MPPRTVKLPEPWASMNEEQIRALDEPELRQIFGQVSTPALIAFRQSLRGKRTSSLIAFLSRPDTFMRDLIPEGEYNEYNRADEDLIVGAAALAVGDEIDNRIPRP